MKLNRAATLTLALSLCSLLIGLGHAPAADEATPPGKLTVTFLELKSHGLAAVLQTPSGRTYLVDTGIKDKEYDSGRDTIAPFLKAKGIETINGIVISHPHGDHYGGAAWLLEHCNVGQLIDSGYEGRDTTEAHRQQMAAYRQLRQKARDRGAQVVAARAGARLTWDKELTVEVLSPAEQFFDLDADPAKVSDHGLINSNSLVLRVQHGKNVFLFPGDAYGGTFERHLLSHPREQLRATVIAAPHHGFNPGNLFPDLIKPEVAVASCLSDYPANAHLRSPRSPGDHAAIVFGKVGSRVFSTARHGNVQIVCDGQSYMVESQRRGPPQPDLRIDWAKNFLTLRGAFPGEVIRVNYLEAYCRPGSTDRDWKETVIGHTTELLSATEDQRRVQLRSTLADGVIVEHDIVSLGDEIDFRIRATNPTDKESQAYWAQPCIRLDQFTGCSPRTYDYLPKSFVFLDGKLARMPTRDWATQARYTPGQVWAPLHVDRNDVNPRPLSKNVPSNGLIGCFSSDGKWLFATAFEPYQELFQGVITCLHSDFRLGGLKPGETKKVRGKIYVLPADVEQLLIRYRRDFPEHEHP